MKLLGLKLVPLAKLRLPGSFRGTLKEPRVHERARSIREHGLWVPPLVRKEDGRVLDGLDRVAATFVNRQASMMALLCECDDDEADRIERECNVQRRHDPEEQKRMESKIALTHEEERLAAEVAAGLRERPKGRPSKPSKMTAAEKQADYRKRLREKEPPVIAMLGMVPSEMWKNQVREVHHLVSEAALRLSQALSCLTEIETGKLPFPPALLQRLRAEVTDVGTAARNATPQALCPYCKDVDSLRPGCAACTACGYIRKNQVAGIPPELLDAEDPKVWVSGAARSVWDYVPRNDVDAMFGGGK